MRRCLLVFANSPKRWATTGWELTQGSYFKCQSCYLLLCSSKHVGEGRKPVLWKPKAKFPTTYTWDKLPSKGMEDAPLRGRVLIARDVLQSHRLKLEAKYQKISTFWIYEHEAFVSWVSPHFQRGGWLCPKLLLYIFFAVALLKHRPAARARLTCRRSAFPSAGAGRLLFCESLQRSWRLFHLDN